MPKIESGAVIKYILGESHIFDNLKKIVDDADNIEDAKENICRIEEALDSFNSMKQHSYRNKWKEGAAGGAIAGALIVSLSPAMSTAVSFWGAIFRVGSGVAAGTAASLAHNEISRNCSRQNKRAIDIHILLQSALNKLDNLDSSHQLKLSK